ncbi:MAG: hypothetical protein NC311_07620 [Muribaculaceae bacterium]|nr:hypothetical protein [Muribaculaceae bacterium]
MADNLSALRQGFAKAKAAIKADLMPRLNRLTADMVSDMEQKMRILPGMTGNTRTSPAGATYADGMFDTLYVGGQPIQPKLRKGEKFFAGQTRYDGDIQEHTFTAHTDTKGNVVQQDNYDFLESQQNAPNEFKATIVGGTEYLGHEQVTDNFAKCQMEVDKYFK